MAWSLTELTRFERMEPAKYWNGCAKQYFSLLVDSENNYVALLANLDGLVFSVSEYKELRLPQYSNLAGTFS